MSKKEKTKKHVSLFVKILRIAGCLLAAVVLYVVGVLIYLMITEYKPADRESIAVRQSADPSKTTHTGVKSGEQFRLLSWNIGYGALGDNADFFMDGGKSVNTADKERLNTNLSSMNSFITQADPSFVFLQEADVYSTRSHKFDETDYFYNNLNSSDGNYDSAFAYNFNVKFMPVPVPPMGRVEGGIQTLSEYPIRSAERISLPCPFKFPMRLMNLKRCLLVSRIPVIDETGAESGKELVLINLHLEAYDNGEGKIAQTNMLKEIIKTETDKGNYVIAGGDFNQTFSSVDSSKYPVYPDTWHCGSIEVSDFPDNLQLLMDDSSPSCRSLDKPYAGADKSTFQYYVIDGIIVSDNITVENFETVDLDFVSTDHNPVLLNFTLNAE
ncbi:MAG: endonuclease [Lachnospiraceae bacterium]|nr:endonuclease [Lachnospiraceae bacterium]